MKNYECAIPKDDFLSLAAKDGWKLQKRGNTSLYEKRYPNGGGVIVYHDETSKRLFVQSNDR